MRVQDRILKAKEECQLRNGDNFSSTSSETDTSGQTGSSDSAQLLELGYSRPQPELAEDEEERRRHEDEEQRQREEEARLKEVLRNSTTMADKLDAARPLSALKNAFNKAPRHHQNEHSLEL